jgi:hypothetical protein
MQWEITLMIKQLSIAAVILLSGCGSAERRAELARQEALQRETNQAIYMMALGERCDGFGFSRGTQQHSQCMMQLHQQNVANSGAAAAAILGGAAAGAASIDRRPSCASLPAGMAGYQRSTGACR